MYTTKITWHMVDSTVDNDPMYLYAGYSNQYLMHSSVSYSFKFFKFKYLCSGVGRAGTLGLESLLCHQP